MFRQLPCRIARCRSNSQRNQGGEFGTSAGSHSDSPVARLREGMQKNRAVRPRVCRSQRMDRQVQNHEKGGELSLWGGRRTPDHRPVRSIDSNYVPLQLKVDGAALTHRPVRACRSLRHSTSRSSRSISLRDWNLLLARRHAFPAISARDRACIASVILPKGRSAAFPQRRASFFGSARGLNFAALSDDSYSTSTHSCDPGSKGKVLITT
jgi:hypothetical protein